MIVNPYGRRFGVFLTIGGVAIFRAIAPANTVRLHQIGIDPDTLAFALVVVLLTGFVVGLVPVLGTCQFDMNEALKADSRSTTLVFYRHRLASLFVASEVLLSLILLFRSGLLINHLSRLLLLNPGYRTATAT